MNVEDPQALKDVADHTMVGLEKSGKVLIGTAVEAFKAAIAQALHDVFAGENNIIAALDGWTLGPIEITIKPIRLNKPKETE